MVCQLLLALVVLFIGFLFYKKFSEPDADGVEIVGVLFSVTIAGMMVFDAGTAHGKSLAELAAKPERKAIEEQIKKLDEEKKLLEAKKDSLK